MIEKERFPQSLSLDSDSDHRLYRHRYARGDSTVHHVVWFRCFWGYYFRVVGAGGSGVYRIVHRPEG